MNRPFVPTGAIQQYRLHCRVSAGEKVRRRITELDVKVLERTSMTPVAYQYGIPRLVPVGAGGTMDQQRTSDPVRILERIVTMVPGVAVLGGLESVSVRVVSGNGTLRDAVDSVRLVGMELTNAVPMDCGSVVWQIIGYMDSLGELRVSLFLKD